MKKILVLSCMVIISVTGRCQQIPNEITFHNLKTKSAIGTTAPEVNEILLCITFRKVNNNITGLNCSTNQANVVFMISGTYQEKKTNEKYTITYNGYHYYPSLGNVNAYLTYGYVYSSNKWYISVEDVLDNDRDGVSRVAFQYYDKD